MSVVAMFLLLSFVQGATPFLEQSATSEMAKAPPMSTVLKFIGAKRACVSHGVYGGSRRKFLQFYSPAENMIKKLYRKA